ncbi:MAG TPA: hypothetical protein VN258_19585, partial [Mobilitalea sp.]|nr:hypothetical protein [Mobilitalea sp.]
KTKKSKADSTGATPCAAPTNTKSTNSVDSKTSTQTSTETNSKEDANPAPGNPPQQGTSTAGAASPNGDNNKKDDKNNKGDFDKLSAKEMEKKYGLKESEYHKEVKPEILKEIAKDPEYKNLLKQAGKNPDIWLSSDGQIEIVSTVNKAFKFITDLNIVDFLP